MQWGRQADVQAGRQAGGQTCRGLPTGKRQGQEHINTVGLNTHTYRQAGIQGSEVAKVGT